MPEIDLGTQDNYPSDSMDAPKKRYPRIHLDEKPAEMLDKQIDGATEMMALVKIKVCKRVEVTENSESEYDFERGPIRLELDLEGITIVPETREGMPKMNGRQNQNFTRDSGKRRQQNEQAVDAGLDMIAKGIKELGK